MELNTKSGGGRTIVDGTGYDVRFAKKYTVNFTGEGLDNYLYCKIYGTIYTTPAKVLVPEGTIVTCYVLSTNYPAYIYVDGVQKRASNQAGKSVSLNYTVSANCSIQFYNNYAPYTSSDTANRIYITAS